MFAKRRSVLLSAVALAGLLLSAAPAAAWHGATFRQRTVVRGYGWGPVIPVGAPVVGFPAGVGVHSQALLLGGTVPFSSQAFFLGGTGGIVPQAFMFGGSLGDQGGGRQADKRSPDSSTGNPPPGGTTPPPAVTSTVCSDLARRLDGIETRLGALQTQVDTIEAKVDLILQERAQQKMQAQMEAFRQQLREDMHKMLKANNKYLAGLARDVLSAKPEEREKKLDELLKKIEAGQ